jgi:hypothetical protein
MDLALDPNGFSGIYAFRQIDGGVMPSRVTLLRIDTTSMVGDGFYTWAQSEIFFVDCNITAFAYVIFSNTGIFDSATLGCTLITPYVVSDNSHVMRLVKPQQMVLSNNTFIGGQEGGHLLKLVGQPFVNNSNVARNLVISDNKFHEQGGSSWPVAIAPVDNSTDERIEDWILERNWHVGSGKAFNYAYIAASRGTIRNNIFDMSNVNPNADAIGVRVIQRGSEPPPNDVHIYNNTFYSGATNLVDNFIAIEVNAPATNTVVRNNFASAPNVANRTILSNSGTGTVASNNVLTDAPEWVSTAPSTPGDFRPTELSPAVGGGITVPVFSDLFLVGQPMPRDLGAVNH